MALVFLFVMLAFMWAFVIRPQQRKVKEHRAFVAGLSVGDEVVTTAGIYGTITDLSHDRVRLEIAPGVQITIARLGIGHYPYVAPAEADDASAAAPTLGGGSESAPDSAPDRDDVATDASSDDSSE